MAISSIIEFAKQQNKNILIIGTPRSGTHALGSLFKVTDTEFTNLGEICLNDESVDPLEDIKKMYQHSVPSVAHIVQLSAKIALSSDIGMLKKHTVIVNLKRRNKVKQFASWMYFHATGGVNGKWHNHREEDTKLSPGAITVTSSDIDLFVIEQLTDDFFLPDYTLYYEDMDFVQSTYKKNQYRFNIEEVFSNLDYVNHRLINWKYHV